VTDPSRWVALQLNDVAGALRLTEGPLPCGLDLRPVELDVDLPQIAALYNTAFGLEGPDAVTPNKALRFTLHPGLHPTGAFLVLDGPVPVGLGVGRVEIPAAGASARLGAVELLAVRPEYRRRGVASALLHAVLGWLAGQGVTHVHASVEDTPALLLLQRYGFSPVSP
jgi:GNAT superfamily N-acetyltransferase